MPKCCNFIASAYLQPKRARGVPDGLKGQSSAPFTVQLDHQICNTESRYLDHSSTPLAREHANGGDETPYQCWCNQAAANHNFPRVTNKCERT